MKSSARQHDQAHENKMAVSLQMYLAVEIAMFLAVENHEIDTVLECLQGRVDGFVLVDFLMQVASAGIHSPADESFLNLPHRQYAHQATLVLALFECLDFVGYHTSDQLAQSEGFAAVLRRRTGKLPVRHERLASSH